MTSGVRSQLFFFNDTATTEIYTLSLHDALPILAKMPTKLSQPVLDRISSKSLEKALVTSSRPMISRSEEHTSELQSLTNLVCRLLLEKKKTKPHYSHSLSMKANNSSCVASMV